MPMHLWTLFPGEAWTYQGLFSAQDCLAFIENTLPPGISGNVTAVGFYVLWTGPG